MEGRWAFLAIGLAAALLIFPARRRIAAVGGGRRRPLLWWESGSVKGCTHKFVSLPSAPAKRGIRFTSAIRHDRCGTRVFGNADSSGECAASEAMSRRSALALAAAGAAAGGRARRVGASLLDLSGAATDGGRFGSLPENYTVGPGGLRFYDYKVGTGPSLKYGQVVVVHYVGYVQRTAGAPLEPFDSSYARDFPLLFKHGSGRMIQGFDPLGLHTMHVGGKRRIVVPAKLAYGDTRAAGPMPLSSGNLRRLTSLLAALDDTGTVVFDVELVRAYDDDADPGYYEDSDLPPEVQQTVFDRIAAIKRSVGGE